MSELRDQVRALALEEMVAGTSPEIATLCALSRVRGRRLDPFDLNDRCVLVRGEQLLAEGLDLASALEAALSERPTWRIGP